MQTQTFEAPLRRPFFRKILVIDDDASTALMVAKLLPKMFSEVIACGDMALAEVALDLTEFDVILLAPSSTGLDGADGLAGVDFLLARNPTALFAVMVPIEDGDLRAAVERCGAHTVLSEPLHANEFAAFSKACGIPLAVEFAA